MMVGFMGTCLAAPQQILTSSLREKLAALETSSGGRIGLFAINTANNTHLQYRAKERFPMCSTSKVMCVAAILKQSINDKSLMQQRITFTKKEVDSSGYAPVTKKHIADGMTVGDLCQAALTESDNTAMNLLMKKLGGPGAVNAFAHSIADNNFRLDRYEPKLNSAIPGDLRDTTTPEAMANSLQQLALGNVLALPQREQLQAWLKNNITGNNRIRAGVPKGWIVGDKTGTGGFGSTHDIGLIWPPNGSPIVVALYFTQHKKSAEPRDDVIASVTKIVIDSLKVA